MRGWRPGTVQQSLGGLARMLMLALLACASVWPASHAHAQAQAPRENAAPRAIDLAAITRYADAKPNLRILMDEASRLTPREALDAPGWNLPSPSGLAPEPRTATLWVRFTATNHSTAPVTRWMVIGSPRIEKIDVFQISARGTVDLAQRSGSGRPLAERPVKDRLSAFPIELAPGQVITVLVRASLAR